MYDNCFGIFISNNRNNYLNYVLNSFNFKNPNKNKIPQKKENSFVHKIISHIKRRNGISIPKDFNINNFKVKNDKSKEKKIKEKEKRDYFKKKRKILSFRQNFKNEST